jgi:hypothetical protein
MRSLPAVALPESRLSGPASESEGCPVTSRSSRRPRHAFGLAARSDLILAGSDVLRGLTLTLTHRNSPPQPAAARLRNAEYVGGYNHWAAEWAAAFLVVAVDSKKSSSEDKHIRAD